MSYSLDKVYIQYDAIGLIVKKSQDCAQLQQLLIALSLYCTIITLHCLYCIIFISLFTFQSIHCTLHCMHYIACISLHTLHCMHLTAYITLHCMHYIAYITLHTLYFIFHCNIILIQPWFTNMIFHYYQVKTVSLWNRRMIFILRNSSFVLLLPEVLTTSIMKAVFF